MYLLGGSTFSSIGITRWIIDYFIYAFVVVGVLEMCIITLFFFLIDVLLPKDLIPYHDPSIKRLSRWLES